VITDLLFLHLERFRSADVEVTQRQRHSNLHIWSSSLSAAATAAAEEA
jgi:hypothetical protein